VDRTRLRALGLDLGSKRIGVALSDSSGLIANPLTVILRSRHHSEDHRRIAEIVIEEEVDVVVVGLPLNMDGTHGPAARAAALEREQLATVLGVPVETSDERRSTVAADAVLMQSGMKAPARRKVVDKVAATVILQGWLDARRERIRRDGVS
jgi:putative Holliday junction resolvase